MYVVILRTSLIGCSKDLKKILFAEKLRRINSIVKMPADILTSKKLLLIN